MAHKNLPRRLYKYRGFSVHSLRLLTQARVYYADPRSFNDPLDCNPTIRVDVDRPTLERLCYKMLLDAGKCKQEAADEIHNMRYLSTEYGDYETQPDVETYLKEQLLGAEIKRLLAAELGVKGVFSLAETWDSPLMWSHYADEHRGLCLEYDTTQMPHPDMAAVDYRSPRSVKTSDLVAWKLRSEDEAGRRVHNTYFFAKSPQWRYEKEWRDIQQSSGASDRGFLITAVYFGLRCDSAVIASIVRLFSGNKKIAFFEIYPLDDSFRLRRRLADRNEIEACAVGSSAMLDFKDVVLSPDPMPTS